MSYLRNLNIGLKRAASSPGSFHNWKKSVGVAKRLAAGAAKVASIALAPLRPTGIALELVQRSRVARPEISPERL